MTCFLFFTSCRVLAFGGKKLLYLYMLTYTLLLLHQSWRMDWVIIPVTSPRTKLINLSEYVRRGTETMRALLTKGISQIAFALQRGNQPVLCCVKISILLFYHRGEHIPPLFTLL